MLHNTRHHSLIEWQRADDLFVKLHLLTLNQFPPFENFELGSQLRRAAYSATTCWSNSRKTSTASARRSWGWCARGDGSDAVRLLPCIRDRRRCLGRSVTDVLPVLPILPFLPFQPVLPILPVPPFERAVR